MRLVGKPGLVVLVAETDEERASLAAFGGEGGHVFRAKRTGDSGVTLTDLGPEALACREAINVVWTNAALDERWKAISNLAPTPFTLRDRRYASIEGFWQGLKYPDEAERQRVAKLAGLEAKRAGEGGVIADTFEYDGRTFAVGRLEHWRLMWQASEAKFAQNEVAREALLSTGDRWLVHKVRRDSRSIPGAILADYWMRIRRLLREKSQVRGS